MYVYRENDDKYKIYIPASTTLIYNMADKYIMPNSSWNTVSVYV